MNTSVVGQDLEKDAAGQRFTDYYHIIGDSSAVRHTCVARRWPDGY